MMERAVLVLLVVALAGCAGAGDGLGPLRGAAPRDAYAREFHDALAPQYNRTYSFPVDAGATALNLTGGLATRSGGVLPADGTPATATLTLLDPDGAPRGQARLDAAHPSATLLLAQPLRAGAWHVRVEGNGAAVDAQAAQVSTVYALGLTVSYGPAQG